MGFGYWQTLSKLLKTTKYHKPKVSMMTKMMPAKLTTQIFAPASAISEANSTPKSLRGAITLTLNLCSIGLVSIGTISLISAPSLITPSAAIAQYGLGLPRSAGTGGATRGNLPQITMIVPEDGAKTVSARPTFYWYIAPPSLTTANNPATTATPKLSETKPNFKITLFLRDGNDRSAKSVFVGEGVADQPGLYKFTLPKDAPELVVGKVQRWQVRWQANSGASQVDVNAPIRRDDDPKVLAAITAAKNDLAKARVYAQNGYWYDAIDAYTNWLTANPQDKIARDERSNLLKDGFKNHSAFSKEQEGNITKLLTQLDTNVSAAEMPLQPRYRR